MLLSTLGVLETEDAVSNVRVPINTPYYDQHDEDYLDKTHEVGTSNGSTFKSIIVLQNEREI